MQENAYIIWEYDQTIAEQIGNKAAKLGELRKIGIKIPAGFILTKAAFLDFITANGIYTKLNKLLTHLPFQPEGIKKSSQRMSELFADSYIPTQIIDELASAGNILSAKTFAVRSSSCIEDLDQASFAGLYDTFHNVSPGNELIEGVKRCWQSAFSLRALAYLKRLDLPIKDLKDLSMAVIIQQMINSRLAGVMFTVSPATGDASKILIEYSAGLGDSVVSGEITPHSILIDKITNQVSRTGEQGSANLLEERYIYQLTGLARRIEEHFGSYQDIEWTIDSDSAEIIILQARPETVWNKRPQVPFHKPGQTVFSFISEVKL
ncbi:PEP/pyruvate-binding domain-containing protein [bacterium]|nr:PEP/pyruvate-binding domain-containing protein [bacterium]